MFNHPEKLRQQQAAKKPREKQSSEIYVFPISLIPPKSQLAWGRKTGTQDVQGGGEENNLGHSISFLVFSGGETRDCNSTPVSFLSLLATTAVGTRVVCGSGGEGRGWWRTMFWRLARSVPSSPFWQKCNFRITNCQIAALSKRKCVRGRRRKSRLGFGWRGGWKKGKKRYFVSAKTYSGYF